MLGKDYPQKNNKREDYKDLVLVLISRELGKEMIIRVLPCEDYLTCLRFVTEALGRN